MSSHEVPEKKEVSLSAAEQVVFDHDVKDLEKAEKDHKMEGKLVGRTKFGLDPAGMMSVRDTAPITERIAESLGTDKENVWPLIKDLHERGPWEYADRLKDSTDPEIKTYIALAAACKEVAYPGYNPPEYLKDRERVIGDLSSFTPDKFKARKQFIEDNVKGFEDASVKKGKKEIKVAIAEGDPALALSVRGYKGCVVRAGEMRFAQTADISDALLESAGLVKGFGEVFNPKKDGGKGGFDRVSPETPKARIVWIKKSEEGKPLEAMDPAVKRIGSGYLLTYKDEELALDLVRKAVEREEA